MGSIHRYTLTSIDDRSFYSYVERETRDGDRDFREAFAALSLVVVPPIVYDADDMTITVVGDAGDLQTLIESLPAGLEASVAAVGDYDRRHGTQVGPLTERQYEAVAAAVEVGYEVPREGGLARVAGALGCAESTASAHLRKAERAVMTRLVRP